MVRRSLFVLSLLACSACSGASSGGDEQGVVLHGFRLVDPNDHSVREQDLCLEHGVVCGPAAAAASARYPRIEGNGRYLLPALWDLNASLWGNDSAKNYEDLEQEMSISQCLRVQLFYGVAHVGTFGMDNQWVRREIKRARALDFPAAELLYPDKALGSAEAFAGIVVKNNADLCAALDARKQSGAPYVNIFYGSPTSKFMPGLSRDLLAEALTQSKTRSLSSYVLVDDWAHAREAAELGASLVFGLPDGPLTDDTIRAFREHSVIYAPALSAWLELPRLLGHADALSDPFLRSSASPDILASFLDPKQLWSERKPELERGQRLRDTALQDVRRMAEAGVHLAQVGAAGWASGTFQGYSAHATQAWLERAGVEPWARLASATVWPAELVGRRVGFAPGAPADFIALDADPVQSAANLRRISFLIRDGKVVQRATLAPDLGRQKFHP